ncbi:MAG: hypothetical protein JO317_01785 [Verrucomicrobiae bacterium]|nr:hypothetical protein [Verrucomicrobiae bacterium]
MADPHFHASPSGGRKLVCIGDSLTRGWLSADYVAVLRRSLRGHRVHCAKFAVDGDLAYHALRRIDRIVAAQPDFVSILLGTNDVNATLSTKNALLYRWGKMLPKPASLEWYVENMRALVRRLQKDTAAHVSVISLPPLGEDLQNPVQREVDRFNATLRRLAREESIAYLPFGEEMAARLQRAEIAHRVTYRDGVGFMLHVAARRYLLRHTFEEISRRHGLLYTTDCIHLNGRGARLLAKMIQNWIASPEAYVGMDRPSRILRASRFEPSRASA